jgi:hypothetical protein
MENKEDLQRHYEALARAETEIELKRVEIEAMEKRRNVRLKLNAILCQLGLQTTDDPLDRIFVYRGYPDFRTQPARKVKTGHGQVKRKSDKRIGVWKHVWKGRKLIRVRLGSR